MNKTIKIIDDTGLTELKKGEIHEVKSIVNHPTVPYYNLKNGRNIAIRKTKPVKYVVKDKYEVGDLVELHENENLTWGFNVAKIQECIHDHYLYKIQGRIIKHEWIKHAIVDDEVEIKSETKKGHPHAALIAAYDALSGKVDHPETWIEWKLEDGDYCCEQNLSHDKCWARISKGEEVMWSPRNQYRISEPPKPWPKIVINGIEVNAPIKDKPKDGDVVYQFNGRPEGVFWRGSYQTLLEDLNNGFLFRSKEDAIAAYKASFKPLMDYAKS